MVQNLVRYCTILARLQAIAETKSKRRKPGMLTRLFKRKK